MPKWRTEQRSCFSMSVYCQGLYSCLSPWLILKPSLLIILIVFYFINGCSSSLFPKYCSRHQIAVNAVKGCECLLQIILLWKECLVTIGRILAPRPPDTLIYCRRLSFTPGPTIVLKYSWMRFSQSVLGDTTNLELVVGNDRHLSRNGSVRFLDSDYWLTHSSCWETVQRLVSWVLSISYCCIPLDVSGTAPPTVASIFTALFKK